MKVELPPRVVFTKEAYFRMMQYCRLTETEVTGFGTVEEYGNELVVREVFIVPQIATAAGVRVDGKALLDFMKWAREEGREDLISTSKLWWHSHAAFNVFRSKTDNDTIDMLLGMQPYVLAVVGNHKAEYECSLHYAKPRASFTNLRIVQEDFNRDGITASIREEIKEKVAPWKRPPEIKPYVPSVIVNPRKMESFESYEDYEMSRLPHSVDVPTGTKGIYEMSEAEWNDFLEKQGG